MHFILPILVFLSFFVYPANFQPKLSSLSASNTQIVEDVNNRRASVGLPPLYHNESLSAYAQNHSNNMARTGVLAHSTNHNAAPHQTFSPINENVGLAGSITVANNTFWLSPEHRASIVGNFTHLGTGVAVTGGKVWVTVLFGRGAPRETSNERVNRIVEDVRLGRREFNSVRRSVDILARLPAKDYSHVNDDAWKSSRRLIEERILATFRNRGVAP